MPILAGSSLRAPGSAVDFAAWPRFAPESCGRYVCVIEARGDSAEADGFELRVARTAAGFRTFAKQRCRAGNVILAADRGSGPIIVLGVTVLQRRRRRFAVVKAPARGLARAPA